MDNDSAGMLGMVGWANRRMGVLAGGDFCIVCMRIREGYAAMLLGHVDDVGLEVAHWEAPHWSGALFLAVTALRAR